MTWTLSLADEVIDARTGNARDGHWGRHRHAKAVRHAVGLLAKVALRHNPAPDTPVHIVATRWVSDRRHRDPGNLEGPFKPALDALVDVGVLEDDCACFVDGVTYHIRYSDEPGWTIELEPA